MEIALREEDIAFNNVEKTKCVLEHWNKTRSIWNKGIKCFRLLCILLAVTDIYLLLFRCSGRLAGLPIPAKERLFVSIAVSIIAWLILVLIGTVYDAVMETAGRRMKEMTKRQERMLQAEAYQIFIREHTKIEILMKEDYSITVSGKTPFGANERKDIILCPVKKESCEDMEVAGFTYDVLTGVLKYPACDYVIC